MTAWTPDDVKRAAEALLAEGAAPGGYGIHSWRCSYPDRYGSCDCVAETAKAVLDAVLPALLRHLAEEMELLPPTDEWGVALWLRDMADEVARGAS